MRETDADALTMSYSQPNAAPRWLAVRSRTLCSALILLLLKLLIP